MGVLPKGHGGITMQEPCPICGKTTGLGLKFISNNIYGSPLHDGSGRVVPCDIYFSPNDLDNDVLYDVTCDCMWSLKEHLGRKEDYESKLD